MQGRTRSWSGCWRGAGWLLGAAALALALLAGSAATGGAATGGNSARLYPEDLVYRGAFAFPAGDEWTYGGHALAYYPDGDPSGPADGHPGSLYAVGHAWTQHVGELAIPAPLLADDYDSLPRAAVLQGQDDITEGLIEQCVYYDQNGQQQDCAYREVGGLAYLPNVGKMAWNLRDWYNVTGYDLDSLGWSDLDLTDAQGVWHIGPRFDPVFHNGKTCNYLFQAPQGFAAQHLAGKWLIAGNHRTAGAFGGSQGPTVYASAPWEQGDPPAPRAEIDALALVYYPEIIECIDDPALCLFPGYRVDDAWGGGAWAEAAGHSAVLIFGRKGLGENYYGPGRPGDCSPYQGWHSDPYEPQILFYDPAALAEVAAGELEPWQVTPYAVFSPQQAVFNLSCGEFASVAYDAERQFIYAAEAYAGDYGSVAVHVWQVAPAACPGDVSGDGQVDLADILLVAAAWGASSGEPGYEPSLDLDGDGVVSVLDVQQVAARFNTIC